MWLSGPMFTSARAAETILAAPIDVERLAGDDLGQLASGAAP